MDSEAIKEFFGALNGGRFDELEPLLAEEVVFEFPGRRFGGRFAGRRRVMVFLKSNQRLFRDGLRFDVHWSGVAGDRAIALWTNAGTTRRGEAYDNRGATVFRLEEGRIAEIQDYLDTERVSETWPPR